MNGRIRIGRIFGVELRLDWSWVLIFVLMSWSLMATLAAWHPDWSPALQLVLAIVGALLFFASVLVHELAHSIAATLQGLPVRSITLFLFGGISNIEREPPAPRIELVMAVVGPLVSVLLGVILLVVGVTSRAGPTQLPQPADYAAYMASLGPFTSVAVWLGSINLLVGVFNLIPAFPLDGGRILRSILWAATGDFRLATRVAAGVGQVFGWALVFLGIAMSFGASIPLFGSGLASGLWLAFIGWFLSRAAALSLQRVVLDEALEGLTVARLMRPVDASFPPEARVSALVHEGFMRTDARAFPVMEGGRLVGLVGFDDVRRVPHGAWDTVAVREIMTPLSTLVTVHPNDPASEAIRKLAQLEMEELPVTQAETLVGMLSVRDIGRFIELGSGPVGPKHGAHAS